MLAIQMIMLLFDTNRFNLNLHNINNVADSLIENETVQYIDVDSVVMRDAA